MTSTPGARPLRLLIAGGGTGGHLFPGVAIAEELRARSPDAAITFVGTRRGIEARVLPDLGWPLELIEISGLKTVGILGALAGLFRIPRALLQARRILVRLAPDAVIGVGGYASGPLVLAARLRGIPTAICEQNSIPGLTNKILGRFVRAVFLSFDESRHFFKPKKILMTGNPVRRDLVQKLLTAPRPEDPDLSNERSFDKSVHVLVSGGSQGAVAVNELASEALIALAKTQSIVIVHQTGEKDLAATNARYHAAGVDARCSAFIKDMAAAYQDADLVIGRAGATTVAELAIAGKPALFIPYPFAADNHQELNAREMADKGAALMFRQAELTPESLAGGVATTARRSRAPRRDGDRDALARETERSSGRDRLVRAAAQVAVTVMPTIVLFAVRRSSSGDGPIRPTSGSGVPLSPRGQPSR